MIEYIVGIIISLVMGTTFILVYASLNNTKIKKKDMLIVLPISILIFINNQYNLTSIKSLTSIIITFIMYKLIFKENVEKTLFYTLCITIVAMMIEIILAIILSDLVKDIEMLNNSYIIKASYSLLDMIVVYLLLTYKKIKNGIQILMELYLKINFFYVVCALLIFVISIIFWIYSSNIQNFFLYIAILAVTILVSIILYKSVWIKYNNNLLTIKNKHLEESNGIYKQISEDYSILRHNLTNDLIRVKSLLPQKDQEVINNIIKKYEKNFYWLTNINDVPSGIQGLFYIKLSSIKNKKIKFHVNYKLDFDIKDAVGAREYDQICEILGIWIDNAIEACSECKEKVILVEIDGNKEQFIIKITNTFTGELDIEKLGNKKYSTKGRNSGYGLNYIKRLTNKKIQISYNVINNLFMSTLVFVKNKKGTTK